MSDQPFADFPQNRSFAKLEILQNSQGNIKSLFLIKFQVPRLATWLKRVSNTVFFLRIFSNFEGIFFIEYLRRLLLKYFEGFIKTSGSCTKTWISRKAQDYSGLRCDRKNSLKKSLMENLIFCEMGSRLSLLIFFSKWEHILSFLQIYPDLINF